MIWKTTVICLGAAIVLAACGGGGDSAESSQLSDSAIGQSRLPGAQGVEAALEAADSAEARRARLDSIATED